MDTMNLARMLICPCVLEKETYVTVKLDAVPVHVTFFFFFFLFLYIK